MLLYAVVRRRGWVASPPPLLSGGLACLLGGRPPNPLTSGLEGGLENEHPSTRVRMGISPPPPPRGHVFPSPSLKTQLRCQGGGGA